MDPFLAWNDALQKRHLANLTFQEVRRSVQALSATYVENRGRLESGKVLTGEGKRAAFAMFYAPLHFLLVRETVRALGAAKEMPPTLLDLGCGTGAAGSAWALECASVPKITGIDVSNWAIQEAQWTYRTLGLPGAARTADIRKLQIPDRTALVAAFTINELDDSERTLMLDRLVQAVERGTRILIVEPIARRITRWWNDWASAFDALHGRQDDWRFAVDLPENLRLMDKAAELDHREITGRSLWIPG